MNGFYEYVIIVRIRLGMQLLYESFLNICILS